MNRADSSDFESPNQAPRPDNSSNPFATPLSIPLPESLWSQFWRFLTGKGLREAQLREGLREGEIFMGVGFQFDPDHPDQLLVFSPSTVVDETRMEMIFDESLLAIRKLGGAYPEFKSLVLERSVKIQLVTKYHVGREVFLERELPAEEIATLFDGEEELDREPP